jgi:hypothetical protein
LEHQEGHELEATHIPRLFKQLIDRQLLLLNDIFAVHALQPHLLA